MAAYGCMVVINRFDLQEHTLLHALPDDVILQSMVRI